MARKGADKGVVKGSAGGGAGAAKEAVHEQRLDGEKEIIAFAKRLAANDKTHRDQALKRLKVRDKVAG
jgi:hypothetical protein